MTKEEAVQFLYQIADEIQSLLDKRPSPKGQWTSQKRLEALSVAISALRDLSQAEQDGRIFPCKPDDIAAAQTSRLQRTTTIQFKDTPSEK